MLCQKSYITKVQQGIPIFGVYPWCSPDGESLESYYNESQEQINKCLHCTKTECDYCHIYTSAKEIRFRELMALKMNWKQICTELSISKATYFRYKKEFVYAG